jgi:hypothetical protein
MRVVVVIEVNDMKRTNGRKGGRKEGRKGRRGIAIMES